MNWLTRKIIFVKTGLLLGAILFFLGCKKEKNTIGLDKDGVFLGNTIFTDTITVKSEVVLINENISTTNQTSGGTTSLMLAGAYTDPIFGKTAATAYTQLNLLTEFVEIPAPTADSAYLFINYTNYYGNPSETQTLNVYKLTEHLDASTTYYSNSPGLAYNPTPIGTVTFNASTDSVSVMVVKITDLVFLQAMLEGSKNNSDFVNQFPGIAIVPTNNTDGAIIRIDGGASSSIFRIYYTQYGQNKSYDLRFGASTKKFFTVSADRSGTDLAGLSSNLDAISTSLLANQCYVQGLTGVRTRISFPYLHKLREVYPNIVLNEASLYIARNTSSNSAAHPIPDGLLLLRTKDGEIMKDDKSIDFHVQPNNFVQTTNSVATKYTANQGSYSFAIRSYLEAVLLEQVDNDPILISPYPLNYSPARYVFNNSVNPGGPMKLNLYFTVTN